MLKWDLLDHTNGSMGDSGAKGDLNSADPAQEVSEEANINMWPEIILCDI